MNKEIGIIGGKRGSMGSSIAYGLLRNGLASSDQLTLTNSETNNNKEAAQADVVILAIKPQVMRGVLQEIGDVGEQSLIISVAAGVTMQTIEESLQTSQAHRIVRVMPNLGARVGESMSVWVANQQVTDDDKEVVRQILNSIGTEREIQEEDMLDKVTALSGSGPAYFFYLVELLTEMGEHFGFSQDEARLFAEQTFIGSAKVLEQAQQDAGSLRRAVTSKGGTTEAAFRRFERDRWGRRFMSGVEMAYRRARELRRV